MIERAAPDPHTLLDEARDPGSPFHEYFTWDDDEAAEQYRLIQAGQLIRRWKGSVIRIDADAMLIKVESVRQVESPAGQRSKGGASYQTVEEIMADPASITGRYLSGKECIEIPLERRKAEGEYIEAKGAREHNL